ncbi:MAG: RagB/SusD family nutrient uptake outer membrane protein [Saprospiraceae bacterium]|nr:RagB/SusD family nutrient uptake outer membrane protein [Saprospiraceae bacterium]MCB9355957.1 RagB/SusD family nutrient uptake outer membrane protein [Lewinellaceae bacterium]
MKHKIKHLSALLLVLLLSACSKGFLDIEPQDRLTIDNFYNNENEIRAATASLYGFPWFDFNDKFYWLVGDCMSGNMYYTYDQEGQFFYFSFTEGNAHLSAGWKGLFRVISYANSIINDMPRAAGGKVSQDVIDRALGEARFVRGLCYFMLGELWEEVPIVENSTELVSSNNLFLPKNTRSSIMEFARRDFVFAADNLPAADVPGRITQWAAKGMLAKLHLTLAQNLGDANSADNFSKARQYAADVIDNSGMSLMPNYADLFKIENNNNAESMFALQWMEGAYAFGNSRQANWARSSQLTGNSECWGGGKSASYDFVQSVEPGDKRQSSIFMSNGDHYPDIRSSDGGYTYKIVNRDPADPNIVLEGAAPVLNNAKKYIVGSADDTGGKVSTGQATAINQYMLRLADIYLIYAEAALGSGSSSADGKALEYLNAIRQRAGLPAKTEFTFADILRERRVEFGFESNFWFDIKRFYYRDPMAALDWLNAQQREYTYVRIVTPNAPDENTVAGYDLIPPASPINITAADMKLPIPAADVVANPMLAPDEPAVDYPF